MLVNMCVKKENTEGENYKTQGIKIWTQVPEKVPGKEDHIEGNTTIWTQVPRKVPGKEDHTEGDTTIWTQVPRKVPGKEDHTEGVTTTWTQVPRKVPGKATTMPTMPTEGQTEKNTGKVKQYIEGDTKEFKKKKRTKNAT